MASTVTDAMTARGKDYAYADRALVRLAARETRHFDFLEISSMDATDCEFIDGFHAGDVVAARMLKAMVKAQDNGLADFVDGPDIERIIKDFFGHALADRRYQGADEREIDFLELGCAKNR